MSSFSVLPIPSPLAEAIALRGYESATAVQVAVLEERCQGHDLLVSSQTGSGKTLAFGVLLAQALLDQESAPAAASDKRGRKPAGLVIAPTRELANQVRSELAWLFAKTRLQIVAFTGGSDVHRDLKVLSRGADIVVGTPGRLVDLLERKALVLEAVQVAVLDEADEMLDMGFREDLETLLGAAAARKRTHMFSATLPRPILQMAARYQGEAVRVDARTEGDGGAHTDIEYAAHVVNYDDRLAAVVNVLRMHADQKAIVFGTTREGVANLHQALVRHGFRAVVLSGDRAQGERNRAIEALKGNEAQVLVATNVAARGLDLPEVDLVLHADLPLNAESLTHRSGRTGRAGRKGRSVVIADPAERRKAERLLSIAKAKFVWTPAPTAEAIAKAGRRRLEEELLAATVPEDAEEARGLANRLLKDHKKEELLEVLLERELARCPRGEPLRAIDAKYLVRAPARDLPELPPRRAHSDFERDAVIFRVNLGAVDKAEPGWILPLICRRGGVTRNEVGAIRVGPKFTEFQIAGDAAADFALAAARPDPRAPHVMIESSGSGRASRYPSRGRDDRPRSAPRPARPSPSRQPEPETKPSVRPSIAAEPAQAPSPERDEAPSVAAEPAQAAPPPEHEPDAQPSADAEPVQAAPAPEREPDAQPSADAEPAQAASPPERHDQASAAAETGRPYPSRKRDDRPVVTPETGRPYPSRKRDDRPVTAAETARPYPSRKRDDRPSSAAGSARPYPSRKRDDRPSFGADPARPYSPRKRDDRPTFTAGAARPYSPRKRDDRPTFTAGAARPYSPRKRDDGPVRSDRPHHSTDGGFQPPRRREGASDYPRKPAWHSEAGAAPKSRPRDDRAPQAARPASRDDAPRDQRKHFQTDFARKPRPSFGGKDKPKGDWKKPR
jgi:ATP-dependent RNA helicase DeaD